MQGSNKKSANQANRTGPESSLKTGLGDEPTDDFLVEQVKLGNRGAFSELVKRHQRMILRLSMRLLRDLEAAEDVVQESFLKAYQKIHMFQGRSAFKSWLYQIAVNTAKNKLRAKRKDLVNIDTVSIAVEADADTGLESKDLRRILQDEIEQLPARQKTALVLRIYEDLSFKEVADIMGCPYDTAKANYRHALIKLRHKLADVQMRMHLSSNSTFFLTRMNFLKGVEV